MVKGKTYIYAIGYCRNKFDDIIQLSYSYNIIKRIYNKNKI